MPLSGHRLDEYLQGTIVSVEKDRLKAEITLTPGVLVFPLVMAQIDTDADGVISAAEQRAYAARVLGDLSVAIDGQHLTPRLVSVRVPELEEMREGRGGVQIEWIADLSGGGRNRKLTIENRHQSGISVYQVNCLVSSDPGIRIGAQIRNYAQSHYELEFVRRDPGASAGWPVLAWGSPFAVLLVARLLFHGHRKRSDFA
jgi:hypothetical protein